jgi:Domain of unknown function (DUF6265)
MLKQSVVITCVALAAFVAGPLCAQTPPPAEPATPMSIKDVAELSWLNGCWVGSVNQRDYREQWSPMRGGMLVGFSSTVFQGRTQNYEFLRLEERPDGVYYVAAPSGQKEDAFKLASITTDDKDTIFTFSNPEHDFPQRIIYRRGTLGWLYAHVEGKLNGEEKKVIYPMRRVGCESGEFILK